MYKVNPFFTPIAACQIPDKCKRTCAEPNPSNCEYNPPKVNMNGCDCKEGYILSKLGGDCIPIDQCPRKYGLFKQYALCNVKCKKKSLPGI